MLCIDGVGMFTHNEEVNKNILKHMNSLVLKMVEEEIDLLDAAGWQPKDL